MRISHSHKFIFLATPRTGSTTARKILDKYSNIASVYISEISDDFPFYNHISALELKNIFEDRGWDWDSYKKFCFVRNPYDRVVSLYHHQLKMRKDAKVKSVKSFIRKIIYMTRQNPSFKDYVVNINPKNRLSTSLESFICDRDGNLLVNEVLMFEKLTEDLPKFLSKLGISITSKDIPHLNASADRQQYRKYYDEELRNRVRDLYKYEFERGLDTPSKTMNLRHSSCRARHCTQTAFNCAPLTPLSFKLRAGVAPSLQVFSTDNSTTILQVTRR